MRSFQTESSSWPDQGSSPAKFFEKLLHIWKTLFYSKNRCIFACGYLHVYAQYKTNYDYAHYGTSDILATVA